MEQVKFKEKMEEIIAELKGQGKQLDRLIAHVDTLIAQVEGDK